MTFPDPGVFAITVMQAGIPPRILEAIQVHAPRTEGDDYGNLTDGERDREIHKLPRYEVD